MICQYKFIILFLIFILFLLFIIYNLFAKYPKSKKGIFAVLIDFYFSRLYLSDFTESCYNDGNKTEIEVT